MVGGAHPSLTNKFVSGTLFILCQVDDLTYCYDTGRLY